MPSKLDEMVENNRIKEKYTACYKQAFLDAVPIVLEMARDVWCSKEVMETKDIPEIMRAAFYKYPDAASIVEELTREK